MSSTTLGMLTLRLWLAVRAIQTGIEKFMELDPVPKIC